MILKCPLCHQQIDVNCSVSVGQNILCPVCGQKFQYQVKTQTPRQTASRQEVPKGQVRSEFHIPKEQSVNVSVGRNFFWLVFWAVLLANFATLLIGLFITNGVFKGVIIEGERYNDGHIYQKIPR